MWHRQFPFANWGILMGHTTIALDCDLRPLMKPPKDGVLVLRTLLGVEPDTETVISGGSGRHFYFKIPGDIDNLHGVWGIDLKKNGFCVAPGSRHLSGNYYKFEDPINKPALEMPTELIQFFKRGTQTSPNPEQSNLEAPRGPTDDSGNMCRPSNSVPAGELKPDSVVVAQLRSIPVSAARFDIGYTSTVIGDTETRDRSREDFGLCCTLAILTNHNWDQYVSLFSRSAVYGRNDGGQAYIDRTLKNAFVRETRNSSDFIKRVPKPNGRPLSATTQAVRLLHEQEPGLTTKEIAKRVGVPYGNVWLIMKRYVKEESCPP
jgi:hypothetical protein